MLDWLGALEQAARQASAKSERMRAVRGSWPGWVLKARGRMAVQVTAGSDPVAGETRPAQSSGEAMDSVDA
jgi:hypothetical protein